MLLHQPVIAGNAGFALGAVGDDPADLGRILGGKLDMRRESRAAQTHDAGPFDLIEDLCLGKGTIIGLIAEPFHRRIKPVVGHDDALCGNRGARHAAVNGLYLAGNGGINIGRNKSVCLCNQLAHSDLVVLLDDRL